MKLNTGSKVFIVDFLDNFVRNLFELCVSSYLGFAGIAWYSPVKLDKSRRKKKTGGLKIGIVVCWFLQYIILKILDGGGCAKGEEVV